MLYKVVLGINIGYRSVNKESNRLMWLGACVSPWPSDAE